MTTRKMKHRKLKGGLPTIINDGNIFKLVRDYINDKQELPEDLRAIPIGEWDVSQVTNMTNLFRDAGSFNEPIGGWDVSSVTHMDRMFQEAATFNQPIGDWIVSNVENMMFMFQGAASFNQPIGGWDVSRVTQIIGMFRGATSFNQPIGSWDVSRVTQMVGMFRGAASFNQPIGGWNVSRVTQMGGMFRGATSFNQPVGGWDVSNVVGMRHMFQGAASFNQPIGNWKVSPFADVRDMFEGAIAFTGTKSVNQPICGDKSLFQVGFVNDTLVNWRPLECSMSNPDNPKNCVPTAFHFIFPKNDRAQFQALSDDVQTTGVTLLRLNEFFYDLVRHLDLDYTTLDTRMNVRGELLPNLLNVFRTNLLPGYATLLLVADPVHGAMDHLTTIVRTNDDNLVLFDGQTNTIIAENAIVDYVRRYRNIRLWCNKHKNKHRLDEEESQPQSQPQSQPPQSSQSFKEIANEIKRRFPDIDPQQVDRARIHGRNIMQWTPMYLTRQLKDLFDEPTTARIVEMLMQMKNARVSEPQPQPQSFKKQREGGKTTRKKKTCRARRSHVKAR
jgi:surface protein